LIKMWSTQTDILLKLKIDLVQLCSRLDLTQLLILPVKLLSTLIQDHHNQSGRWTTLYQTLELITKC
jgi:hypothetical protein